MEYELKEGDGAFYGPKIDFDVLDSIGRPWQLGTIQLDYSNPERFDLTYVGEDNAAHRPVIIHRAVSGSLERFIAILIEHFAGAFPVWLAPEQVRVLPITDDYREYAEQVTTRLHDANIRVHLDARSETLKYRVAEGARMKVPYMLVVGKREAEMGTVAVNVRGAGKEQKPNSVPLDEFVKRVVGENTSRTLALSAHADVTPAS
jgi:threonyl-tRNA synthetase